MIIVQTKKIKIMEIKKYDNNGRNNKVQHKERHTTYIDTMEYKYTTYKKGNKGKRRKGTEKYNV